ncbi:MAG: PulJ/GspJ family protein [Armatimonadota bacterium]
MSYPGWHKNSGFTLVEMMVALLAFAILLTASYAAFRAGTQSSIIIEDRIEVNDTARILLMRIDSELKCICRSGKDSSEVVMEGVNGESDGYPEGFDSLMFTTSSHTPCSSTDILSDVCSVMYSSECDSSGKSLGLYIREDFYPGLHTTENGDDVTASRLTGTVTGMECSYLDEDSDKWVDEWVDKTDLPEAVRIDLTLQPSNKNASPVKVTHTIYIPALPELPADASDPGNDSANSQPGGERPLTHADGGVRNDV